MTQRRIYQNEFPYFITFRTREGMQLFDDTEMAGMLAGIMFKAGELKRYDILAYQVMPDHVHVLAYNQYPQAQASLPALASSSACVPNCRASAPTEGCARRNYNISQFIHTIKSFFCDQIRDQYGINYPVLQKRFYIRIVDTDKYLHTVIEYIKHNPVKAELPRKFHRPPYRYFNDKKFSV